MNIFVTLGLEWFPFVRLIEAMDAYKQKNNNVNIYIQTGRTEITPKFCKSRPLLRVEEFEDKIENADIVVCHGGIGTVLSCFNKGVVPIVFPRYKKFKEHIDNHQVEFCKELEMQKKVPVAWNNSQLFEMLDNYNFVVNNFNVNKDNEQHIALINYLKGEIENTNLRFK